MRYLPSLLRVQILSNNGICLGANISKFDQMWYLLHICIDFAVVVNPFFRAVLNMFKSCLFKHRLNFFLSLNYELLTNLRVNYKFSANYKT